MLSDVLSQTCTRIFAVGVSFAALWAIVLVLGIIAPRIGGVPMIERMFPVPGLSIAAAGVAASLLLTVLSRRLSPEPELLLFVGSAFLVITSLFYGVLEYWAPRLEGPQSMWIGASVLIYSSIVPNTPGTTLGVGLLAATMAPLGLIITLLRGVQVDATPFQYFLSFLPNYLCAALAVIPSKIIHRLGQQVKHARELGSYRLEELLGKGGMGEVY
jgi:hypothetical protein